jgi:hypothetical protein
MQRAAEWKQTLRTEPRVARLLLRRLIGPIELYDASKPEWQMPDFIKADAEVKTGLIDGLAEIQCGAPMPASWNQIASWLKQLDAVRSALLDVLRCDVVGNHEPVGAPELEGVRSHPIGFGLVRHQNEPRRCEGRRSTSGFRSSDSLRDCAEASHR